MPLHAAGIRMRCTPATRPATSSPYCAHATRLFARVSPSTMSSPSVCLLTQTTTTTAASAPTVCIVLALLRALSYRDSGFAPDRLASFALRQGISFYIILKPSEPGRASYILFLLLLTHAAPSIAFEDAALMQSQNEVPVSDPCKLCVNLAHRVSPSRRNIILQRRYHRMHLQLYAPHRRTLHPPGARCRRCTTPANPRGVLHVLLIASSPHQRILG
jgi:hypothetical protein